MVLKEALSVDISDLKEEKVQLIGCKWEEVQPILPSIIEWRMDWLQICNTDPDLQRNFYRLIEHIDFSRLKVLELHSTSMASI